MTDIIDEIKQEVNQERLQSIILSYLPYIAILVVLILSTTCVGLWYKNYKLNKIYDDGSQYLVAVNKMKAASLDEGLKKFESISNNDSNYSAIAKFNLASYALYNKEYLKATALFNDIAANTAYHSFLRSLASLYEIETKYESNVITLEEAIIETQKYEKANSEFKYSAQEYLAALYLKSGKLVEANQIMEKLVDNSKSPMSINQRVEDYISLIK